MVHQGQEERPERAAGGIVGLGGPPERHEGVVDDVLRQDLLAGEAVGEPVGGRRVAAVELVERRPIARRRGAGGAPGRRRSPSRTPPVVSAARDLERSWAGRWVASADARGPVLAAGVPPVRRGPRRVLGPSARARRSSSRRSTSTATTSSVASTGSGSPWWRSTARSGSSIEVDPAELAPSCAELSRRVRRL